MHDFKNIIRMRITFRGIFLHDVNEGELIDSTEWESCKVKRGELFQVERIMKRVIEKGQHSSLIGDLHTAQV